MADQASSGHSATFDTHERHIASNRVFGFWVYIMTDTILFASIFATYAVLNTSFAGGPTGKELFDLPSVLLETIFLLTSSFTFGLGVVAVNRGRRQEVLLWLAATFVLGAAFVGMELSEFGSMIAEGFGPRRSAFLSGFFGLVGTHGLHVTFGLLWIAVMMVQLVRKGVTIGTTTRMMNLSLFWHFLDIVWICVFTVVYLLGVM